MTRVTVSAEHPEAAAILRAVTVLQRGGVVAYPTDTVYGIAVDPRHDEAAERLFAVKGRERGMAVPLIAADAEQAFAAGLFGPRERRLAEHFWPGPLSIVVPAAAGLSRAVLGGRDTVAVRVPAHAVARALAGAFGFCITATSANRSGEPATQSPDAVGENLPALDLLLAAGDAPGGPPSTIVAFDAEGPVLVRAGAVAFDRVVKLLR
jgi:L-threonylcarbamoyladenylate synthase